VNTNAAAASIAEPNSLSELAYLSASIPEYLADSLTIVSTEILCYMPYTLTLLNAMTALEGHCTWWTLYTPTVKTDR